MRFKKKQLVIFAAFTLMAGLIAGIIWSNTALELDIYTIESSQLPKSFDGFRIAQVSDLHNVEKGKDNEKLLTLLREAKPDMIAITGDLIDSRRTDMDVALRFAEQAMQIAPCYYVPGNHESRIEDYDKLKSGLDALGVIILTNEMLGVGRDGETITLLGLADPAFQDTDETQQTVEILEELSVDSQTFTVLLAHRPEFFDLYAEYNINLILSGHTHGGQFRLPFIGAVIAPGQGLFPKYDAGLYATDNTNMIISRGIGNTILPLRFCNPPEVVLVELKTG